MNIFEKETGFIGDAPLEHLLKSWEDFWQQALSIRKRLGNKVYLFDNYLDALFNSVNNTLAQDSGADGLGKLSEQRSLLVEISEAKTEHQSHPLYKSAKEYIEKHPMDYQEHNIKFSLYEVGLVNEIFDYITQKYSEKETYNFSGDIDFIKLQQSYEKICILLGSEEQMEKLNFLFRQCFIIVPPMLIFLQGVNNDLIYILTHRDDETHRQIFQLYLESLDS